MNRRVTMRTMLATLLCTAGIAAAEESSDGSFQSPNRFMEKHGEAVFRNVCAACHMPDAKGAAGAARYPALAGNANLASADYVVSMILIGRRAMPSFASSLNDDQIAGVVNYLRTHFGNDYPDAIAPSGVKAVRP
jgi:mono/diheme cytochrome c family protein